MLCETLPRWKPTNIPAVCGTTSPTPTSLPLCAGAGGRRPLVCIGINPSTAQPGALDPTLKSVERLANANGFDSWIMFNVYPSGPPTQRHGQNARPHPLRRKPPLAAGRAGPDRAHRVGRMGYSD